MNFWSLWCIYIYILNFVCLILQSLSLTNGKENHQKKEERKKKIVFSYFNNKKVIFSVNAFVLLKKVQLR